MGYSLGMGGMDRFIVGFDRALRACLGEAQAGARASPAAGVPEGELAPAARREAGRLMRVNHCGEVCAQALYLGQALSSRQERTASAMRQAAAEEEDHLAWCAERLRELDAPVSKLNPLFYGLSFGAGLATGLLGDRVSLGFVAATEAEVVKHLDEHIGRLPEGDERSAAVLRQMREDEARHGSAALREGGLEYSSAVKGVMRLASRVMTRTTYWL